MLGTMPLFTPSSVPGSVVTSVLVYGCAASVPTNRLCARACTPSVIKFTCAIPYCDQPKMHLRHYRTWGESRYSDVFITIIQIDGLWDSLYSATPTCICYWITVLDRRDGHDLHERPIHVCYIIVHTRPYMMQYNIYTYTHTIHVHTVLV